MWQVARQTPEGGGRISRLPITASLILECLAALALALILAGARIRPASVSEHLVVLLDDSASMSAVNANGESPRDRAARRVLSEIERLGSSARVTLVLSGERPSVLLGPAARAVEARSALEKSGNWKPAAPHHSIALGLRLARELAGKTGRLMALSDAPPPDGKEVEDVFWVSVGEPLANVGITAAQRTISPLEGKGAVLLSLGNFSDTPTRRKLTLKTADKDARELVARDIDLPPGTSSVSLPLPAGVPAVKVTLSDDALQRDNEVLLVEPRPQEVGVENHLPEGRGRQALSKALSSISGVTLAEHGHLAFTPSSEFDRPAAPGVWRVGFGRAPAAIGAAGAAKDFIGPFVPEKRDPLMEGITLAGVVWTGASPLAPGVHPLISAGDQPLIVRLGQKPESGILFNLDLDRTNLIRAPDWPILISNLVEMRRQSLPGPDRWNYRIGEWIRVRLGRDPKGTLRIRGGGIERTLPAERTVEFSAPSPGGLLQVMEGDAVLFELGVNFLDENETNLRGKSTSETGKFASASQGVLSENGPASDPLFWVLVVIGGLAIILNWYRLSPRTERKESVAHG